MTLLRRPIQKRSRETMHRIVRAAAETVARKGFHDATIREICSGAGVTMGAFYVRFENKADLAFPLLSSLQPPFRKVVAQYSAEMGRGGIQVAMPILLTGIIKVYRRHGDLLRALIAEAGTSKELAMAMRDFNNQMFSELLKPVFDEAIKHPHPKLAMRLALLCVLNALKEVVLDQQLFNDAHRLSDSVLVEELTLMFLRYVSQ